MADFDADDFDIDELLDEIDSSGTKGKESKPDAAVNEKQKPSSAASTGTNKSVRFSEDNASGDGPGGGADDDFISRLPRSQRDPPSSSLRTMFFADSNKSSEAASNTGAKAPASGRPPIPPSASTRGRPTAASSSADWLGIQDGKGGSRSGSPSSSPPPRAPKGPATTRGSSMERNKSTGNSSEEEEALFQDIGIPRTSRRSATKPPPPQSPASAGVEPRSLPQPSQNPRSRTAPPGDSSSGLGQETSKPLSVLPPKPNFSSSYLDQLGMSPPISGDSPKTSLDLIKPSFGPSSAASKSSSHQPLPSTASLLGSSSSSAPGGPGSGTVAPLAPSGFPLMKPPPFGGDPFSSFSLTAPSVPPPQTEQQNQPVPLKKKGVKNKDQAPGSGISSTLQLPSHLINEDELKAMSSSLKTLYSNQLDMLEKSYKEQMEFINAANRRKEELLKQEMKAMQSDYEERLERLRTEVRELETSRQLRLDSTISAHDIETLQSVTEKLNTTVISLEGIVEKSKGSSNNNDEQEIIKIEKLIKDNLERHHEKMAIVEERVCGSVKGLDESVSKRFGLMNEAWRNLLGQIKTNMIEVVDTVKRKGEEKEGHCIDEIEKELEKLEKNVKSCVEQVGENAEKKEELTRKEITVKLTDLERVLLLELAKMLKLQRKIKEQTDGFTVEPIVKVLEVDRDDEQRRREKLAVNVKEMRRDIKRISIESENRQESLQKFNMSMEMELKSISQSIRDLNSQLKFSLVSGPDNMTNQFNASLQQTQAEMEMKLLRDERQALSDSMAQVNVEKRKISEERVELEKQKLDFQKEKDKLKNLELELKNKIDETEEMQKKTEKVRREEIHLTSEAQVKLKELEKEKAVLREKLMEAEQRLRAWEQKLRQEKLDLVRDREFIDKLRDQLLCPGCMKQNDAIGVIHPPPPPYMQNELGGALLQNTSSQGGNLSEEYFNSRLNLMSGGTGGDGDSNDLYDIYYRRFFD